LIVATTDGNSPPLRGHGEEQLQRRIVGMGRGTGAGYGLDKLFFIVYLLNTLLTLFIIICVATCSYTFLH